MARRARLVSAAKRKVRRISGWNVFQRQQLSQKGSLSPQEFKAAASEVSRRWSQMSHEEKADFHVQANIEHNVREQVKHMPLPVKGAAKPDEEAMVSRNGLKKLSAQRLQVNLKEASQHPMWSSPRQLGDSSLAMACVEQIP